MVSKIDILEAHDRIATHLHRTPVFTSQYLDHLSGARLFFKCENFQKVGAFKARGAMNAVLSLHDHGYTGPVATHSSGNHAQALAFAAARMGMESHIVMPRTAPKVKKEAVRGYGGNVVECEPTLQAREATLADVVKNTRAEIVHPYNDYRVIAGQATALKEVLEDHPDIEVAIAPVGGGGLLSGTALSARYFGENVTVYAGEPEGANDAWKSMIAGHIVPSESPRTIADGLLTSLGDKTFPIIKENVKEIYTVSDDKIKAAMRLIWERMKIIIEPSCAVPLAAILANPRPFRDKNVAVILTGGNVDLGHFFDSI